MVMALGGYRPGAPIGHPPLSCRRSFSSMTIRLSIVAVSLRSVYAIGFARRSAQYRLAQSMISRTIRWASLAILLCVAGCGFVRDEALDGPYRLVAVDIPEDMSLCRSVDIKGDCLSDGLPGPTVFQAGSNSQYIVFSRHPRRGNEAPLRSVSEFYYISRQANERDIRTPVSLSGPFNELEYQQEKRRLQLPEFSTIFADLK
jgi:hypothetical protein